jgi:carbohydrate diacid regulator
MSNRLFQGVIQQMKDTLDRVVGVVDENGAVIACSELGRIGEIHEGVMGELSGVPLLLRGGWTYKPFGSKPRSDYAVFVEGSDQMATKYAGIIAISLSSIKQYYDERYDRGNFVKNVILDNILPGDIYLKARELHLNSDVVRAVLLIRVTDKNDVSVYDVVQNLFPDRQKDFVINVGENDIALVKEVKASIDASDLEKLALSIGDTLLSAALRILQNPLRKRRSPLTSARFLIRKKILSVMTILV